MLGIAFDDLDRLQAVWKVTTRFAIILICLSHGIGRGTQDFHFVVMGESGQKCIG